ncbi:unnamed protein product [Heligmosomoides polygyrus]|uniref:Uncharacterized protein n=1 Tax=Heligmosomoides polygyrus TaxID=6339 RepID=A0A183GR48_HELPZ|nr:unnamed protein product [Heligmosomoides polygyrus]
MEPLRPSERQALQKLTNTVSRTLGKKPATRTEKDYADIMSAARKFVQVFQKPRSERHTTHDVRVLQVFTSWVYYTVEAFRDSALDDACKMSKRDNVQFQIINFCLMIANGQGRAGVSSFLGQHCSNMNPLDYSS